MSSTCDLSMLLQLGAGMLQRLYPTTCIFVKLHLHIVMLVLDTMDLRVMQTSRLYPRFTDLQKLCWLQVEISCTRSASAFLVS